ncbi:MAG: hypothetical protein ILA11_11205 [Butyrivibrio sp.]|nr:hypothetical protein [Butyrivibrio sp.]
MNNKERHIARRLRREEKRNKKKIELADKYTNDKFIFDTFTLSDSFYQTGKASRWKKSTQSYRASLLINSQIASSALLEKTWKSKGFRTFSIKERGKVRLIQSVNPEEKCIQSTLSNNCLIPILTKYLIFDNGASLKYKGTDFALNRFTKHLRDYVRKNGLTGWIFFYDFEGYFRNIDRNILKQLVRDKVINDSVLWLYDDLIDNFGNTPGIGLGSQVSQISAVYYPSSVDHCIKDFCGVKGYGRYMDDGYIIDADLHRLKQIVNLFMRKCNELSIKMNYKKCQFIRIDKPFTFLKTRFFITKSGKVIRRIGRKAVTKERHRLRKFKSFIEQGKMPFKEVNLSFHSWLCGLTRGRSYHICLNTIRYFNELFKEYGGYRPPKKFYKKHGKQYKTICRALKVIERSL